MKVELDLDDGILSDIDEWRDDLPYKPSRNDFIFLAICHYLWDLNVGNVTKRDVQNILEDINEQGTDADYEILSVKTTSKGRTCTRQPVWWSQVYTKTTTTAIMPITYKHARNGVER